MKKIIANLLIVTACIGCIGCQKKEEKAVEPPVITLYQEEIITGVHSEIDLQKEVVASIESEAGLDKVKIDLHEKEDENASADDSIVKEEENDEEADAASVAGTEKFVINDVKDGKEENGVPAKTIQFLEEGTYELDIMAVDTEENKAEMTVMFKVGDELLSYVKGFQDWTVEVKSTDIDFMNGITWDKEHVKDVTVDDTNVDFDKTGEYEVIYTVVGVNGEEVKETVKVAVVSEKEAQEQADEGAQVTTSGGKAKKDSNGKTPTGPVTSNGSNNNTTNNTGSNNKPSNNTGSNNNPPSNNGSNNNPPSNNNGNNNSNTTTKCSHNWVEQFKTVHHDEVGHYEDVQVLVKDAWTEERIKYKTVARDICNGCGLDITDNPAAHVESQVLAGIYACGGHHTEWVQVPDGTETVYHAAEYTTERKWVVDSAAYDEQVTTGWKCSICGETK